ncbi:MAG: AbgT family transporter [Vicinamibacterales bacterium]
MPAPTKDAAALAPPPRSRGARLLDWFERVGNRFPDPIVLFLAALAATWVASGLLAGRDFGLVDPRTGAALQVHDQLTARGLAAFVGGATQAFVTFPPLGMVLVMVIGVAVAERSGLVGGALRGILSVASPRLLTPLVGVVALASHLMADGAIIIVVPLAGALFYVAGRHPLAGILAGFAPMSGAMFANFVPYALDPIVAGFSEIGARIIAPAYRVNPLSNYWLAIATAIVVVPVTWWLVERVVEPRLRGVAVGGDPALMPAAPPLTSRERRGLWMAAATALALTAGFAWVVAPPLSPMRAPDGSLTGPGSPVMQGLIPLMLLLTLVPSLAYGAVAGTIRNHRQVVDAMASAMAAMGYYIVMVFFAALFTKAFADSNIGALIALEGAEALRSLAMPPAVTILGIVVLTAAIDFLVPSASAKWALLAPILVPMLMGVGIAPELTQAAFRVGDGPVNLVTPLMPYFPLVLSFCRRYVTGFGVGTLMSLLLPFGVIYLALQVAMLLLWWGLGLPLGIGGRYVYP